MIKANELRIGNYIFLLIKEEDGGEIKAKIPFQIKSDVHLDEVIKKGSDYIGPIPLTPKILEKCGFDGMQDGFNFYYSKGNTIVRIHYLHQLQNLHRSLTGEELEIKEL